MSEQEAQDKARAEAEKRWPPSPYAAHYEEPLLESSCRVAFVAGAAWERSRVVEAAPSDTDREALTDEALWDFAHDLLDVWNVEDLNPPSLVEQFRDQFVARFGASQPVQVEVTTEMVERAAKVLYADYEREYEIAPWSLAVRGPFMSLAAAALSAALGGGE